MKKTINLKAVLMLTVFCAAIFACSKAVSPTRSTMLPATVIKSDSTQSASKN